MNAFDEFDTAPVAVNPFDEFDAPARVKPAEAKPSALRRIPDIGVAALKSVIGLPEAAVGIADLASGGRAGKAVQDMGVDFKAAKDIASEWYSPQQQAANTAVQQADGFFPTAAAMLRNPSTIGTAISSLGVDHDSDNA